MKKTFIPTKIFSLEISTLEQKIDNDTTEKPSSNEIKYPSSSILLEICKDEYTKEKERATNFETKAGLFLTGIIALITIYLDIIPFQKISSNLLTAADNITIIFTTIYCLLLLLAFIFIILSFFHFTCVLDSQKYMRVEYDNLNCEQNNMAAPDLVMYAMNQHYYQILKHNTSINNKKANKFSLGIKFTLIAFILLIISTILILFI